MGNIGDKNFSKDSLTEQISFDSNKIKIKRDKILKEETISIKIKDIETTKIIKPLTLRKISITSIFVLSYLITTWLLSDFISNFLENMIILNIINISVIITTLFYIIYLIVEYGKNYINLQIITKSGNSYSIRIEENKANNLDKIINKK
jgi:hypothetical protein